MLQLTNQASAFARPYFIGIGIGGPWAPGYIGRKPDAAEAAALCKALKDEAIEAAGSTAEPLNSLPPPAAEPLTFQNDFARSHSLEAAVLETLSLHLCLEGPPVPQNSCATVVPMWVQP